MINRYNLFHETCVSTGVHWQHLPGIRIGILPMHTRSERSANEGLRVMLSTSRGKSTMPVRLSRSLIFCQSYFRKKFIKVNHLFLRRSSFDWNSPPYDIPDMFSKPGTPCNDYNGYCDVFQKCREVSGTWSWRIVGCNR